MGCGYSVGISQTLKLEQPGSSTEAVLKIKPLPEKQIRTVRITWRCLEENLTERGVQLFFRILDENPRLQDLFPWRNVPKSFLSRNPIFRGHASRFMQAIGAVVDSLDSTEQSVQLVIYDIGKKHSGTAGFELVYIELFSKHFLELLEDELGEKFTTDVRQAWSVVIDCLVKGFKTGYKLGMENNGTYPENIDQDRDVHKYLYSKYCNQ